MKKILAMILCACALVSLCACGAKEASGDSQQAVGATIDLNLEMPTIDVDSPASATGAGSMDLNFPSLDLDFDIKPVEVVKPNKIEFDIPDFDFTFTYEPITVTKNDMSFDFADYDFTFDMDSFDVNRFAEQSGVNFSAEDMQELSGMDVADVVILAEKRANLLADLEYSFKSAGLEVEVDETLGEIMLDSSILFGVDQYQISAEGKEFLKKFMTVYTAVVYNSKYDGFLSQVLVEGHTDSDGNYDYNMTLSQKRAESVMAFCLSEDSGVDAQYLEDLQSTLKPVGYSYDKLIYDENGNEDKAASRRVSFRFLIALP